LTLNEGEDSPTVSPNVNGQRLNAER